MISNTRDLAKFAEAIRAGGIVDQTRILSPATVAAMTRDQLALLDPFADRRNRRRQGLAWILKSAVDVRYGDLASDATYGHAGATGSLLWVDPINEITFVFLSNKEGSLPAHLFSRLSNAVVAALTG